MQSQSDWVGALNELLEGEISAVETYRQALAKVDDPLARRDLVACEQTHEKHVMVLRERISELGGTPTRTSGVWGTFARLVEGGARLLGDKTAIAALEEGEDHGLKIYRKHLGALDPESRRVIEEELLPEQERTHAMLSSLKHTLH
jgi:demethoxyubiquinone hydroxylase (CLK1/Coq7/Cat5 family)